MDSALVTALDTSARSISGSDTAVAGDNVRTIEVKTATVIVTLSDAATMGAGYVVNVFNASSGDCTVALASATDTIDTVTNSTQTVGAKEWRRYVVNAATNGYLGSAVPAATTTVSGRVQLAAQADMETGTSTTIAVTPGVQKNHPLHPKAGGASNASGSISASSGISSVTNTATGRKTVNFSTAFSSANYWAKITGSDASANASGFVTGASENTSPTTTAFEIVTRRWSDTVSPALGDCLTYYFDFSGDQ